MNLERIHFRVPLEVFSKLEASLAPGQTVNDLVDAIFADEAKWNADRCRRITSPSKPRYTVVRCDCCSEGPCRCPWFWRGMDRCGCSPERLELIAAGGDLGEISD